MKSKKTTKKKEENVKYKRNRKISNSYKKSKIFNHTNKKGKIETKKKRQIKSGKNSTSKHEWITN
jgi:hypothetical protein